MSNLSQLAKKRYTTKVFDPTKRISDDKVEDIKTLLQYSASSVNSQPWHFVLASTEEGKRTLAESTENFAFNTDKILNASHVVALCVRTEFTDEHLDTLMAQEDKDGRFASEDMKKTVENGRNFFVNLHRKDLNDADQWMEKQVYLALGNLLLGASVLDIDACPIEGFDAKKLDEVLGLTEKGYRASVLVALGYHAEEDFNANLPKSRLPQEVIFTEL